MKNRKIKTTKIFKIGILFLGISMLLWNCEKESEFETFTEKKITPQKITLPQAKKDQNFINISNQFKINSYFESEFKSKSKDNFQIDFSNFYKIEKENYVSYTFLIKTRNKDKSFSKNLVVEKKNDTVRGYIIKYSKIFYKKIGTELFLNAKTIKTHFKGNIEELLEENSINLYNEKGYTCGWTTTYFLRTCTEHGTYNKENSSCNNQNKSNWDSYSSYTCVNVPAIINTNYHEPENEFNNFGSGGGGNLGGNSVTVPIINCDGEEGLQPKTASSDCIEVLEEEEFEWIDEDHVVIETPSNTIDLNKYLKCFENAKSSSTFSLTIYVDQPIPNKTDTWTNDGTFLNPDINVGHTFISLSMIENGVNTTQTFGFYPASGVTPRNPQKNGAWVDDGGHSFDVSAKINLNLTEFQSLVNNIKSLGTPTYNLNSMNCTDAAIQICNNQGMSLPDTSGSWLGGGGSNPGNLGQDIRNMSNSKLTYNKSGGSAPTSKGNCN